MSDMRIIWKRADQAFSEETMARERKTVRMEDAVFIHDVLGRRKHHGGIVHNGSGSLRISALPSAFSGFGVLAYRIGAGAYDESAALSDAFKTASAEPDDLMRAMTAAENMRSFGYAPLPSSIATLARIFAALRTAFPDEGCELDPASDVAFATGRDFSQERFSCMYPDFPSQVMSMDESVFRFDQLMHYCSTYGVEETLSESELARALGIRAEVLSGWMPDVSATDKTVQDIGGAASVPLKWVRIVATEEELRAIALSEYEAAHRLSDDALDTVARIIFEYSNDIGEAHRLPRAGFRENSIRLALSALDAGFRARDVVPFVCDTPDDVFKLALSLSTEGNETGTGECKTHMRVRLTTSAKRALCRVLERFEPSEIRAAGAEAKPSSRRALARISPSRHIKNKRILSAVEDVLSGRAVSYNARIEHAYGKVFACCEAVESGWNSAASAIDELVSAFAELLALSAKRPGMMLRSAVRLSKACDAATDACIKAEDGSTAQRIEAMLDTAFVENASSMSLPSLVQASEMMDSTVPPRSLSERLRATGAAPMYLMQEDGSGGYSAPGGWSGEVAMRRIAKAFDEGFGNANKKAHDSVSYRRAVARRLVEPAVRAKIASCGGVTELSGQKAFIDWSGVIPEMSVLLPNEAAKAASAFPMPGLALRLPETDVLRLFVFWDDREKRVDVDLHAAASFADGSRAHIGWDGDFKGSGLVMSGDITTSCDSAEYIDIDVATARERGISSVDARIDIYAGARSFADIATVRAGVLSVKDTEPNAELYSHDRCIASDDLRGLSETRDIEYARIGIDGEKCWLSLKGGSARIPGGCRYTLSRYVEDLVLGSGGEIVAERDEADVVLRIGAADGSSGCISLSDNGYFLGIGD